MLGPAGLSSDSGLGGSTDGSTDILVFGSVVDSVTEEGMRVFCDPNLWLEDMQSPHFLLFNVAVMWFHFLTFFP